MKIFLLLALPVLFVGCRNNGRNTDWPAYGGNKENNRYSDLRQINVENVKKLDVAWIYNSNDSVVSKHEIQCQPIVVNGVLYGINARLKLFALDAASGQRLWQFDPFKGKPARLNQCRGVTYWEEGKDKRIFYVAGNDLFAVNAVTGEMVWKVPFTAGLDINHDVRNLYITATSPGVVYKNTLIFGNTVSESGDAAPGYVRGFDAVTGKLIWTFHTVPQPGEPGYATWPKDAYKWVGGTNNWSGLALDERRGAVYFGTGSPSSDFYGGDRAGMNLFSDCVVALDAATGQLKWYYQTIHHDLWDRDIPCPPNLATIRHDGRLIDVVVQVTKDGNVFVLDRDSGKSVFPVEERPVATGGLPGEHPWPVQNFPVKPLPLCLQSVSDSDITDLSPEAHAYVKRILDKSDHGEKFMPPNTKGTVLVGYSGGAEWGGNAIDSSGILYQNANTTPWLLQMISQADRQKEIAALSKGQGLYVTSCSPCHGADRKGNGLEIPALLGVGNRLKKDEIAHILVTGQGRMPSFQQTLTDQERSAVIDFLLNAGGGGMRVAAEHNEQGGKVKRSDFPYVPPYISKVWEKLEDSNGYPGIKPPWGTLNAIDLNTGEYVWKVPLGEYPELAKKGIPTTGTESYGGPLVTAGGLIFIAGTRDEKIRAFDKQTGKVVWEYQLPAGGFATPITYIMEGRQYVVIAAGGGRGLKAGGSYIAFALPENKRAGFGGWILMGCFVLVALAFRKSRVLRGFSFTVMIFAVVSLALYYPQYFITVGDFKLSRLILPLLQVIMFGMGTELSLKEFRDVVKMPKGIFVGVICHYTIMPLVSFCIIHLFHFPPEIAAGIILVGCCPSGLASNVMSWLARANLALSVSVTTVSTLLAPFITPLLMRLLAGELVAVHFWSMVWDITQIVILPIVAGLAFNFLVKGRVKWLDKAMPVVSMVGITAIIVVITAAGRDSLLAVGLLLIAATVVQNVAGYTLGYWAARLFGMEEKDCRTISLEVGMQNAGLASGIALAMGRLATVGLAPAVFGPMMNISGSSLATWWHRKEPGTKKKLVDR